MKRMCNGKRGYQTCSTKPVDSSFYCQEFRTLACVQWKASEFKSGMSRTMMGHQTCSTSSTTLNFPRPKYGASCPSWCACAEGKGKESIFEWVASRHPKQSINSKPTQQSHLFSHAVLQQADYLSILNTSELYNTPCSPLLNLSLHALWAVCISHVLYILQLTSNFWLGHFFLVIFSSSFSDFLHNNTGPSVHPDVHQRAHRSRDTGKMSSTGWYSRCGDLFLVERDHY